MKPPKGYIAGLGRDYPHPKIAHLYKGDYADPGLPMCRFGWNRLDGTAYSVWRSTTGEGLTLCKTCLKRAEKGLDGVEAKSERFK